MQSTSESDACNTLPEGETAVALVACRRLEVSGTREPGPSTLVLWLQVRDVAAELDRLAHHGVQPIRAAREESWGLVEAWIQDPDGTRIVLVQVPEGHPLRRDQRSL